MVIFYVTSPNTLHDVDFNLKGCDRTSKWLWVPCSHGNYVICMQTLANFEVHGLEFKLTMFFATTTLILIKIRNSQCSIPDLTL